MEKQKVFNNGKWEGEGLIPFDLIDEEIKMYDEVAAGLARKHAVSKVHVVVQVDPETFERSVCYIKEANYITKLAIMDKSVAVGIFMAADELRETCIIKEASDAITYGDSSDCDRYKLGAVDYCMTLVTRLQNQFKKK